MIHMLACNTKDCPWRRMKRLGCAHPDGIGKVITSKSLRGNVPENCPVRKHPDILVAPPPAGGLFLPKQHALHVIEQAKTELDSWYEMVLDVHQKR